MPFATRTETVLRRRDLHSDPAGFNDLTGAEVAGWRNTGLVTLAKPSTSAYAAIGQHHDEAGLRSRMDSVFKDIAIKAWSPQVCFWDSRFTDYVPKSNATVYDIATAD